MHPKPQFGPQEPAPRSKTPLIAGAIAAVLAVILAVVLILVLGGGDKSENPAGDSSNGELATAAESNPDIYTSDGRLVLKGYQLIAKAQAAEKAAARGGSECTIAEIGKTTEILCGIAGNGATVRSYDLDLVSDPDSDSEVEWDLEVNAKDSGVGGENPQYAGEYAWEPTPLTEANTKYVVLDGAPVPSWYTGEVND